RRRSERREEKGLESVILRGIFKVGKKSHDVLLTQTRLTWTPIIPETPTGEVTVLQPGMLLLQDVFAVKVKRRRAAGQESGGAMLGVALFFCKRKGRKLEEDTLHLHNASAEHTHAWYNALKEQIAVTEKKGHTLSVIKECKLDEYNGVVCVGGDGSVAELCHALVFRAQLDANLPEKPVKAVLPLGIIPAGTKNNFFRKNQHIEVLCKKSISLFAGHLQQVDMCSFSPVGQSVHFGFSAMFGFGGRSLARAEKKRWMASSRRREYALVKTLTLEQMSCPVCNLWLFFAEGEGEASWTTKQGQYLSISVIMENTSRSEFIKHLKRFGSSSGEFSFSFVETHAVSAVKIRPLSMSGFSKEESEEEGDSKSTPIIQPEGAAFPWNIDGELVEIANEVLIRVHPRLISLYGEEVEEAESTVSCSCI
uniref:Ceramide kinase-like n=1 Tax=Oryzias latipes TaxID=8090 RepID=A0A3B3IMV1_ORYLA